MTISDRIAAAKRARTVADEDDGTETITTATPKARRHVDPFADLKRTVHQRLLETLGPKLYDSQMTQSDLETKVRQTLQETLAAQDTPLTVQDRTKIAQEIADDILGYGPIEPFLRDDDVTEVMVNGCESIWLEKSGKLLKKNGRLLVLELLPHDEEWVRERLGHRWLGLEPSGLAGALEAWIASPPNGGSQ